jgi:unsaturated chondroitin disaccharide hydrolase
MQGTENLWEVRVETTSHRNYTCGMKDMVVLERTQCRAAFDLCVRKTRNNIKRLADEPKSGAFATDGNYFDCKEGFFDLANWTSSFFTGMALLAWREAEGEFFLQQVQRLAPLYREKVFAQHAETMHDLGFLYSLYSVALYKLTGDQAHREVGLRAAEVLSGRFVPEGGYIRAWGRMDERNTDYAGLAIIDCMMNLPLLFWASQETGNDRFREIAIRHADTTLKCFVRDDDSVLHAFRFDPKTGAIVGADNYCGSGVNSHWARGAAWAIYGFALAHRYTKDKRYLDAASRLALKFLASLNGDAVPVWDFKLPAGAEPLRDSSAAAIAVCGISELARHGGQDSKFFHSTRPILLRLCAEDYFDSDPDCPGMLRNAQIGDGVGKAKNAYTSWGDYYLMEALSRELDLSEPWW